MTAATRASARSYRWPTIAELWTFLGFALPALAALLVAMPAVDLAYQLRAGAEILDARAIPAVDSWTFTVHGQPWLDQQWGAQVLLGAVYQAAGWTGLAILRSALVALAFALVQATLRAMGCANRPAALLALASFAVAAPALALRPQLFAIVLFAASTYVVADRRAHPRRLWLLPIFAAVWANLHGTFPLILVVVGLGWLDEFVRRRLARDAQRAAPIGFQQPPDQRGSRLLGSTGIALIGAVTAVATLMNPFGIEVWWYVVRLASNPEVSAGITEWRPPSLLDPTGGVFYLSLLIALGVIALRVRADGNRVGLPILAPVATLLGFGLLGVLTGRGLAWWALVLPIAGASLAHDANLTRLLPRFLTPIGTLLSGPKPVRADGSPMPPGAAAARATRGSPLNFAVGVVLTLAAVALLPLWRPLGPAGVPIGTLSYAPQGIADWLREREANGPGGSPTYRIWAPQVWGSWLELAVPRGLYAVDSRVELFPAGIWTDVNGLATGRADWEAVLNRNAIAALVVTPAESSQLPGLGTNGRWVRCYQDSDGSIWLHPGLGGTGAGCP